MKESKNITDLLNEAQKSVEKGYFNTYEAYMSIAYQHINELPDDKLRQYFIAKYDSIAGNPYEKSNKPNKP